jgi:hypothetical protein
MRRGRAGAVLGAIAGLVVVALLVTQTGHDDQALGRSVCAMHGQQFSALSSQRHVVRATSVRCLAASVGPPAGVRFYSYPLPSGQPTGIVLALVFVGCVGLGGLAEMAVRRLAWGPRLGL